MAERQQRRNPYPGGAAVRVSCLCRALLNQEFACAAAYSTHPDDDIV